MLFKKKKRIQDEGKEVVSLSDNFANSSVYFEIKEQEPVPYADTEQFERFVRKKVKSKTLDKYCVSLFDPFADSIEERRLVEIEKSVSAANYKVIAMMKALPADLYETQAKIKLEEEKLQKAKQELEQFEQENPKADLGEHKLPFFYSIGIMIALTLAACATDAISIYDLIASIFNQNALLSLALCVMPVIILDTLPYPLSDNIYELMHQSRDRDRRSIVKNIMQILICLAAYITTIISIIRLRFANSYLYTNSITNLFDGVAVDENRTNVTIVFICIIPVLTSIMILIMSLIRREKVEQKNICKTHVNMLKNVEQLEQGVMKLNAYKRVLEGMNRDDLVAYINAQQEDKKHEIYSQTRWFKLLARDIIEDTFSPEGISYGIDETTEFMNSTQVAIYSQK